MTVDFVNFVPKSFVSFQTINLLWILWRFHRERRRRRTLVPCEVSVTTARRNSLVVTHRRTLDPALALSSAPLALGLCRDSYRPIEWLR